MKSIADKSIWLISAEKWFKERSDCMSSQMNAYNQYRTTAISTASPEKLLLMLYDGLTLSLKQAKLEIDRGDVQAIHNSLIKGQNIISELICTLNSDYEISANLSQLYDYMKWRLIAANLKKDSAIIDEVLGLVSELRSVWAKAMNQLTTVKATASGSVR
jgi:flagellar protein FliS